MDKQKEFNEVKEIVKNNCNRQGIAKYCPERIAEAIIDKGYGNVKEAVKEFADKLKEWLSGCEIIFYNGVEEAIWDSNEVQQEIDRIFKELYGED